MKIQGIQLVKRAPKDGVSVARIDNYYLCEATGTVPAADDSRWTLCNEGEKIPVPTAAAPYLWHKSVTVMSDGTTLPPVIEFCGSLGKNGFDYDLVPSASTIVKKEDGTLSPSRVSCSLIRREADGTATGLTSVPSGYFVKYLRNSAGLTDYVLGTPISVDTSSSITFVLYYGSTVIERHDIRVISEGAQGVTGRGIQSQDYRFRALAANNTPVAPTSDTEWNLWYALANAGYSAEKPYLFHCIKTVYVDGVGVTTTEYTVDGPTVWGNDAVTYEIQPENGSMIDGKSYSLYFYIYKIVGSQRTLLSLTDIKANDMQCIETGGTMLYSSQLKKFVFAVTKAVFGQEYTFGLKSSSGELLCSYTWTVQKQGDKGDDGKSTLYIDCVPDSFMYPADADGQCIQETTNIATLRLMYGTTQVTDYSVEVRTTDDRNWYTEDTYAQQGGDVYVANITRDGNDTVISINVGEASYADENAWVQVRMTTKIDGKEVSAVKQINCYANKEGQRGEQGMNYVTREWSKCNVGDIFYSDELKDGLRRTDIVIMEDGSVYRCTESFTLSDKSTQAPNVDKTHWQAFTTYENVATGLLLAKEAYIKNLLLNYAMAKNENGEKTIEIDGKTGKVTMRDVEIAPSTKYASQYTFADLVNKIFFASAVENESNDLAESMLHIVNPFKDSDFVSHISLNTSGVQWEEQKIDDVITTGKHYRTVYMGYKGIRMIQPDYANPENNIVQFSVNPFKDEMILGGFRYAPASDGTLKKIAGQTKLITEKDLPALYGET